MEQNNLLEPIPAFRYEVFDRQLQNFCMMTEVMINGWNDYSTQEMVFDINSLYIKAELCYMADPGLGAATCRCNPAAKEGESVFS